MKRDFICTDSHPRHLSTQPIFFTPLFFLVCPFLGRDDRSFSRVSESWPRPHGRIITSRDIQSIDNPHPHVNSLVFITIQEHHPHHQRRHSSPPSPAFPTQLIPSSISRINTSSSHTLRKSDSENFPSGLRNLHIRSIDTTANTV